MSRLTSILTCTLLLAWTAHQAGSVVAQETGDAQQQEETATNTQTEAVDQADQLPEPQARRQGQQTRPEERTTQADSQQLNQRSDRRLDNRQPDLRNQQSSRQADRQLDRARSQQMEQERDQLQAPGQQRLEAQGRFDAQGRLDRDRAALDGQARGQQQFDLGAEFSGSQESLTVTNVNEGTVAAEIGLRANDEIISVGGRTISSADQLNQVLVRTPGVQERVPIVVRRAGAPTTLYLSPQLLPEPVFVPARRVDPGLGVVLVPRGDDRLFVREVTGGLADIIGLRENDVIVSVAGRAVASPDQFTDLLYSTDAEQIPIVIIRDGRREALFVRQDMLGFRMYDEPGGYLAEDAWLGVVLDAQYEDAAVVRRVVPGSPADDAGVRSGDWIVSVNGRRVTSPNHLTQLVNALEPGQRVELDVSRRVSGTLVARLEGQDAYQPRQALRPTYDVYEPGDVQVRQRQFYRGEVVEDFDADADMDRGVIRDRFGPAERGLRDRLDWDNVPDEPRGLLPRR